MKISICTIFLLVGAILLVETPQKVESQIVQIVRLIVNAAAKAELKKELKKEAKNGIKDQVKNQHQQVGTHGTSRPVVIPNPRTPKPIRHPSAASMDHNRRLILQKPGVQRVIAEKMEQFEKQKKAQQEVPKPDSKSNSKPNPKPNLKPNPKKNPKPNLKPNPKPNLKAKPKSVAQPKA